MYVSAAPAAAMQILEAVDGAELTAEVSAGEISRIALVGDRIAKVIRAPGGFATEHDPATGDLYLMPEGLAAVPAAVPDEVPEDPFGVASATAPVTPDRGMPVDRPVRPVRGVPLFIGTEKGFTYRLALIPVAGGSAQILIRNGAAAAGPAERPEPGMRPEPGTKRGPIPGLPRW